VVAGGAEGRQSDTLASATSPSRLCPIAYRALYIFHSFGDLATQDFRGMSHPLAACFALSAWVYSDHGDQHAKYHRLRTSTPILSDDSLIKIFSYCRPDPLGDDDIDDSSVSRRTEPDRERWWYKLAQVCRKWRFLTFASASHLGICLFCTHGTPVAEMLAHSRSLPLAIDYVDQDREITREDEEGILCALRHRHRIRRIRLCIPVSNLQIVILAMVGEFPMLEYLYIKPPANDDRSLTLPETFQAPHLRHITHGNVTFSHSGSRHDSRPTLPPRSKTSVSLYRPSFNASESERRSYERRGRGVCWACGFLRLMIVWDGNLAQQ